MAIHVEMAGKTVRSSHLSLSSAFTCTGAAPDLLEWLSLYLEGKNTPFPLSFGTPFQSKVLQEMQQIPFGQTLSYGELAEKCGYKGAARAVGQVCKINPFPLFIPCHRVIRSDGGLGGFAFPLEVKKRLLDFERASRNGLP